MDKTLNNAVSVKLADYTVISSAEKTDRGGWVNFGVNNLFPQYLRELAQTGAVHGSLCISIGDMIAGKALNAGIYNRRLTELEAYDVFYGCAHDYKKYGGFYMEVIYTYDRESVAKLRHIPFEECRLGVSGEDEEITGVWHSNDWAATKRKRNKPEFVPLYNVAKKAEEPRQIYYCFNYTSGQFYPRPDYYSAINSIELAKEISIYHINNIVNGLMPSFIVSLFQGAPDPDQQNQMKRDWERELTGAKNAGKFIMTFNERDTPKPDITTFPLSDADKQYQFLSTESTSLIMVAHRVTTPLLFGIRDVATGFGSNKDEMAVGLEIFTNQVIEPAQRKISKAFEDVLSFEMPGIQINVVPNTPLAGGVAIAPAGEVSIEETAPAAEASNVAGTALNGAQIASMVEILIQAATGILPIESAKGVIRASFPTLTNVQIDEIFSGIKAGSVNPNEVAMGAFQTFLSHVNGEKKKECTCLAAESFPPTGEMKAAAELGLKWRDEYNRGGTEVGVARARDISNGRNLSIETITRMNSYFARHAVDKEASGWNQGEDGFPSAGRIAWELWGGDAGRDWAARMVERIERENLNSEIADELIKLGEDAPEGYILIDSYEVDYDNDDLENEELIKIEAHELAVSTGSAKPMAPSDQDETNYAGVTFMTRYRYFGKSSSNRPFCAKMMAADKLYRKEDIEAMENKVVNPKWGPNGTDYYSIWLYKGGGNCNHAWRKETFINAKGINPLANDAQRIAVAKAAKMGYRVKNDELVALLPIDMDYNGFLETNPVYGKEGKNYRR
jgi:hypothetical protein